MKYNKSLMAAIETFLSNPTNIVVLTMFMYLVLYMLIMPMLSLGQVVASSIILIIISVLQHIRGVSKGILIAVVHKNNIQKIMKSIEKQQKN